MKVLVTKVYKKLTKTNVKLFKEENYIQVLLHDFIDHYNGHVLYNYYFNSWMKVEFWSYK